MIKRFSLRARVMALVAVAAIAALIYFYVQTSLNLALLGMSVIVATLILVLIYHRLINHDARLTMFARPMSIIGALVIVAFGMLSVKTLNNYLDAPPAIYTNADHTVIEIKGFELLRPDSTLLAANHRRAIFDSPEITGALSIASVNDSLVTLKATPGFLLGIYNDIYAGYELKERRLLNKLPTFNPSHPLYLKTQNGKVHTFKILENIDPDKNVDDVDKITVRFTIDGDTTDIVHHTLIRQGVPMTSLIAGLAVDSLAIDASAVHITRPVQLLSREGKAKLIEQYDTIPYTVELHALPGKASANTVVAVSTDNISWHSAADQGLPQRLRIPRKRYIESRSFFNRKHVPLDNYISIGYTPGSQSFAFVKPTSTGARDGILVQYRHPMRRYLTPLDDTPANVVLLTQSLNVAKDSIDRAYRQLPDNVMLFDIFNHADNINRMRPQQLAYTAGPTSERLLVQVYDFLPNAALKDTLSAGARLRVTEGINNPNLRWEVRLVDLKQQSRYTPAAMKWHIMSFALLLALLLMSGNMRLNDPDNARRPMFSAAEFALYMVTLFLVVVRWLLLWRVSVFPPVMQISAFEYHSLFQKTLLYRTICILPIAFVAIAFAIKVCAMHRWPHLPRISDIGQRMGTAITGFFINRCCENRCVDILAKIGIVAGVCVIYAIIIYGLSKLGFTWLPVMAIILAYIAVSAIVHSMWSPDYLVEASRASSDYHPSWVLLADTLNSLIVSVVFAFVDAGYAMMFFTFSMVWLLWSLFVYARNNDGERSWSLGPRIVVLALFVLLCLLVGFYRDVLAAMSTGSVGICIFSALIGGAVVFGIVYVLKPLRRLSRAGLVGVCVTVIIGTALCGLAPVAMHSMLNSNRFGHTAQRIRVHTTSPDEAMQYLPDEKAQNHYIQAALNHMIMGEYNDRGSEISLVGEHGAGYFKMQPHSRVGAMWGAQLSDISLVRFLIAEHSQMLGPLLILMFAMLLVCGALIVKHHKLARTIIIQIPLLLTVQALLIWLANTQRFIFLGQDFPMISINSTLSIALYFTLMTIWLGTIFYEQAHQSEIFDEFDCYDINKSSSELEALMLAAIVAVCTLSIYIFTTRRPLPVFKASMAMNTVAERLTPAPVPVAAHTVDDWSAEDVASADAPSYQGYDDIVADSTLSQDYAAQSLWRDAPTLNELLIEYQKKRNADNRAKGIRQRVPKSNNGADLAIFFKQFDTQYNIDSLIFSGPENKLGSVLWRRFVDKDVLTNSPRNVMHARRNSKGYIEVRVLNRFFNDSLPHAGRDRWRGSLLYADDVKHRQQTLSEARMTVIPGSWTISGRPTALVSGAARIEGDGQQVDLKSHTYRAAAQVLPAMEARALGGNGDYLDVPDSRYIARNIRVNGYRTFIYPLGADLYWAKPMADELASRKNLQRHNVAPSGNLPADYHNDIHLTISPDLNRSIYNIFAGGAKIRDKSVIIADGNGHIAAMVDYKRGARIDPNDTRLINRIVDSLYMIGRSGSQTSRRLFGNSNLLRLPQGPGSSQKPIVWSAVAMNIEMDWDSLRILPYRQGYPTINGIGHYVIDKFNGVPFLPNQKFEPPKSDECRGQGSTLEQYMKHSSNVYNALMVYLGSWPASAYDTPGFTDVAATYDNSTLLAATPKVLSRAEYVDRFPLLSYRGRPVTLNARPLGSGDSWLGSSVLQQSLDERFGIHPVYNPTTDEGRDMFRSFAAGRYIDDSKISPNFSAPEPSVLSAPVRSQSTTAKDGSFFMENAVRFTAIGAQKVWDVTPLQMAEAFGRMASLNADYRLGVFADDKVSYTPMQNLSEGYKRARPQFFRGLNGVVKPGGTAAGMGFADGRYKGYYIYAKTGTIGEERRNHHRLGVIITDKDLTDPKIDPATVKYYVLYFAFSGTGGTGDYAKTITAVIDSKEFKKYMSHDAKPLNP